MTERKIVYADEDARMSYEMAAAVKQLDQSLPPEDFSTEITLIPISFREEDSNKGETALFFANDFMETNDGEIIFYIRPRTQKILDALKVPYQVISPKP